MINLKELRTSAESNSENGFEDTPSFKCLTLIRNLELAIGALNKMHAPKLSDNCLACDTLIEIAKEIEL